MDTETLKSRLFVSCPYSLLVSEHLETVLTQRIQPEISLNDGSLDRYRESNFKKTALTLASAGLSCTFHAPFTDLSLGAVDRKVRRISRERIERTIGAASLFSARSIVFHTGFDKLHYGPLEGAWMENANETLESLVEQASAAGIPLMLENVYEWTPAIHAELFRHNPSSFLGFCLDLGHQVVFSSSDLQTWLDACGARLGQLHLHDNHGKTDEHLAIGRGILDFDTLFSHVAKDGQNPLLTLEAHKPEDIPPSLAAIARLLTDHRL